MTFASLAPGIVVSPIAGALLDRHGRVRLIALDFIVALTALIAIGVLTLAGQLSAELFVAIAVVTSFTAPLSLTGCGRCSRSSFRNPCGSVPTRWTRTRSSWRRCSGR